jgi:hypothetical protein
LIFFRLFKQTAGVTWQDAKSAAERWWQDVAAPPGHIVILPDFVSAASFFPNGRLRFIE